MEGDWTVVLSIPLHRPIRLKTVVTEVKLVESVPAPPNAVLLAPAMLYSADLSNVDLPEFRLEKFPPEQFFLNSHCG